MSGQKLYKIFVMIVDDDGIEYDILCDNMFFGCFGQGEYGIYFIGYFRYLWVMQKMLECMFFGDLLGMYDCLFDFLMVYIGVVFFVFVLCMLSEFVEVV